jgi:hypothetical protein
MRKPWGVILSAALLAGATPAGADQDFETIGQRRNRCLEAS